MDKTAGIVGLSLIVRVIQQLQLWHTIEPLLMGIPTPAPCILQIDESPAKHGWPSRVAVNKTVIAA